MDLRSGDERGGVGAASNAGQICATGSHFRDACAGGGVLGSWPAPRVSRPGRDLGRAVPRRRPRRSAPPPPSATSPAAKMAPRRLQPPWAARRGTRPTGGPPCAEVRRAPGVRADGSPARCGRSKAPFAGRDVTLPSWGWSRARRGSPPTGGTRRQRSRPNRPRPRCTDAVTAAVRRGTSATLAPTRQTKRARSARAKASREGSGSPNAVCVAFWRWPALAPFSEWPTIRSEPVLTFTKRNRRR